MYVLKVCLKALWGFFEVSWKIVYYVPYCVKSRASNSSHHCDNYVIEVNCKCWHTSWKILCKYVGKCGNYPLPSSVSILLLVCNYVSSEGIVSIQHKHFWHLTSDLYNPSYGISLDLVWFWNDSAYYSKMLFSKHIWSNNLSIARAFIFYATLHRGRKEKKKNCFPFSLINQ